MADPVPFSLESADPVWKVKLPDGTIKTYDPWETLERLQSIPKQPDAGQFNFDGMRQAFGFPTAEEAEKGEPKPFTPSRHKLIEMSASLQEFVEGLAVSKKMSALGKK